MYCFSCFRLFRCTFFRFSVPGCTIFPFFKLLIHFFSCFHVLLLLFSALPMHLFSVFRPQMYYLSVFQLSDVLFLLLASISHAIFYQTGISPTPATQSGSLYPTSLSFHNPERASNTSPQ